MAGNVMIFVQPGTEGQVVATMASHLNPGGLLISGFQLGRSLSAETYAELAHDAGLEIVDRFSAWDRTPWTAADDYVVYVHKLSLGVTPG